MVFMMWTLRRLELELAFDWTISRSSCTSKTNFVVELHERGVTGAGEVAFNSRYGESLEKIEADFIDFQRNEFNEEIDVSKLFDFSKKLKKLDIANSLKAGIESALFDWASRCADVATGKLLGSQIAKSIHTTFSIPILDPEKIGEFVLNHQLHRFSCLKLKVSAEGAMDSIRELRKIYKDNPIRIDANESWCNLDDFLKFDEFCQEKNIQYIEQPFSSSSVKIYETLKTHKTLPIFADESLTSGEVSEDLVRQFDGVNVKIMKSGGPVQALRQIKEAKGLGMKIMLGCMVETSLGISMALNISENVDYFDLDGFMFLKADPYCLVTEQRGVLSVLRT